MYSLVLLFGDIYTFAVDSFYIQGRLSNAYITPTVFIEQGNTLLFTF